MKPFTPSIILIAVGIIIIIIIINLIDNNSGRRTITYKPPDPDVLEKYRQEREKEKKMFAALREIIFHLLFVFVLFVVSYGFRNPNAFFLKNGLAQSVIGHTNSFNDVSRLWFYIIYVSPALSPPPRIPTQTILLTPELTEIREGQ